MAKKLLLIVSAVITLLAVANDTFAFDGFSDNWYRWNGGYSQNSRHYIQHRRGPMMVLPPSREMVIKSMLEKRTIIIWVTNDNGSKTEVKVIGSVIGGYTGPKGEYYASLPTEEQLKASYGLPCAASVRNNVIFYLGKNGGSEIVVVLTKDGSGFLGPKGEYYASLPTEEQLKQIYGK